MSDTTTFTVKSRTLLGKKVTQLRREGFIPANVYGVGQASVALKADLKTFVKLYEEEGETGLIYLSIDEKKAIPVLIDEVQYHPVTGQVLHAAFKQVNLLKKITAEVPVEMVGENNVPGMVVTLVRDSIEVEALPTDLPESFELDIATLKVAGDSITFANLVYDKSKITLLIDEADVNSPLVQLEELREEKEEVVAAPEADAAAPAADAATETPADGAKPAKSAEKSA